MRFNEWPFLDLGTISFSLASLSTIVLYFINAEWKMVATVVVSVLVVLGLLFAFLSKFQTVEPG